MLVNGFPDQQRTCFEEGFRFLCQTFTANDILYIVQLRHIITAEDNTVNKQDYYCLSFTAIEYSICKQYSIEKISAIFIAWLKWVLKQNK